jgi:electron transfer flavoprotein beta subunit
MHIVVCLKQVLYTYARTGTDPERHFLTPEDTVARINRPDEAALELALRVKDARKDTRVTLLTLGPLLTETELRRCLALGADRLCRIAVEEELDSWSKAQVLSRFIREMGVDLILCGRESMDLGNGQVGAFLAREMGLPLISAVRSLTVKEDGRVLRTERGAGRGTREIVECPLPALGTVEGGAVELRFPSFPEKAKALSRPIEILSWAGETPVPRLVRIKVAPPRPRPLMIPTPDSRLSAAERIGQLLTGSRMEKKGRVLMGDPESQIEGIVSFIKELGFLEPDMEIRKDCLKGEDHG